MIPAMTPTEIRRFWAKVKQGGPDECWPWTATVNNKGYGQFGLRYRLHGPHRISWMLEKGKDPGRLFVCHKCDNPPCCNPRHLFLGTQFDNMKDMIAKGRADHSKNVAGSRVCTAKLDEDRVREIWRLHLHEGLGERKLGAQFGVTPPNIHAILSGKTWKSCIPEDRTPHIVPRNGRPRQDQAGQRIAERLAWARSIIERYGSHGTTSSVSTFT